MTTAEFKALSRDEQNEILRRIVPGAKQKREDFSKYPVFVDNNDGTLTSLADGSNMTYEEWSKRYGNRQPVIFE